MVKLKSKNILTWSRIENRLLMVCPKLVAMAIFAFCSIILVNNSTAAEIQNVENPNCILEISGVIQKGDFERFLPIAKEHFIETQMENNAFAGLWKRGKPLTSLEEFVPNEICLNSSGGNLVEGLNFAKYFFDKSIGTVIDDGQKCLSICALMFMMGTDRFSKILAGHPGEMSRKLHVNGILGFHQPSYPLPQTGKYNSQELSEYFEIALESAVKFLTLANSPIPNTGKPVIYADLIQKIFTHEGNDLYFIDTVNKVGRWEITTFGFENFPKSHNDNHAYHACTNMLIWRTRLVNNMMTPIQMREFSNEMDFESEISIYNKAKDIYKVTGAFIGDLQFNVIPFQCFVQFKENNTIHGCGFDNLAILGSEIAGGPLCLQVFGQKISGMHLPNTNNNLIQFHPETKLKDLASGFQKK